MSSFDDAFNFVMLHEVGPWWNPLDPDVITLRHSTPEQRRKVGWVKDPDDAGGETLLGIAKASHPNVNFDTLDLAGAKAIYRDSYWAQSCASALPGKFGIAHFDAAVNLGVKRAVILLQQAVGAEQDGIFGKGTLEQFTLIQGVMSTKDFLEPRRKFYMNLVQNKPMQGRFLRGWLSRLDDLAKVMDAA